MILVPGIVKYMRAACPSTAVKAARKYMRAHTIIQEQASQQYRYSKLQLERRYCWTPSSSNLSYAYIYVLVCRSVTEYSRHTLPVMSSITLNVCTYNTCLVYVAVDLLYHLVGAVNGFLAHWTGWLDYCCCSQHRQTHRHFSYMQPNGMQTAFSAKGKVPLALSAAAAAAVAAAAHVVWSAPARRHQKPSARARQ